LSKLHPFIVQIDPGWVSSARWLIGHLANPGTLDDVSAHVDLVVNGRTLNDAAPPEPILPMLRGISFAWAAGGEFRFHNAPITIVFTIDHDLSRHASVLIADAAPVQVTGLSANWFERTFAGAIESARALGAWADRGHEQVRQSRVSHSGSTMGRPAPGGDSTVDSIQSCPDFESPELTPLFSFASSLRWRSASRTPLNLTASCTIQAHVTGGDRLWIGYPAPRLERAARRVLAEKAGIAGCGSAMDEPSVQIWQVSHDALVASLRLVSGQHSLVGVHGEAESAVVTAGISLTPFFRRGAAANSISTDGAGRASLHVFATSARRWRTFDLPGWTGGAVHRAAWAADTLLVTGQDSTEAFAYDGHSFRSLWRIGRGYPSLVTQYLVPGYVAVVGEQEMAILSTETGVVQSRIQRFWWHFEFGAIDRRGTLHIIETSESGRRDYLRLPPDGLLALVA
jgi:hypothetical protein